ncbi:MAG TPA: ParB N-terminal domain-containing protein [Mycobacteriales bacterium]|nr:ParB N-terminal domain-containing protein [Mycobacteriales bacterium]
MKLIQVATDKVALSPELSRSGRAKQFEERLQSSIDEIGLAEPLKVAPQRGGGYVVIDGGIRLRAIRAIRANDPSRFETVSAYVLDYKRRYEIRYQSDIYQDLLPSQLATLVEHLHKTEHVRKVDIARYIGVSPATLRNYTGLWRLIERGGLFAHIVELMDVGVLPASNPYAWLRLTDDGLRTVLQEKFATGSSIELWLSETTARARLGHAQRFPLKFVEAATDGLPPECYREGEDVRAVKRDLGLRRATSPRASSLSTEQHLAHANLAKVTKQSKDPVLRAAAKALQEYLR